MTRPNHPWYDDFQAFLRKEISSKEFAKRMVKHYESPEWLREKARREAQDLERQKAGRARLFELIEEARKNGREIDYEFVPLREGHDSVLITVDKTRRTGFPSFMWPEMVEEAFNDLLRPIV